MKMIAFKKKKKHIIKSGFLE